VLKHGQNGVEGLGSARGVAVSPDGRDVYVASELDAISVFSRNPDSGTLTFTQVLKNALDGVSGLEAPVRVVLSPDGKNVYVAASSGGGAAFLRNQNDGSLTFLHALGQSGTECLAVTPDGKQVVTAGGNAVRLFDRDLVTGVLTLKETFQDGVNGVDGLSQGRSLQVDPEGQAVFLAAPGDGGMAVLVRDPDEGSLTFYKSLETGPGGFHGPGYPVALALDGEGKNLYVASAGSSGGSLTVLDTWLCGP